MSVFDTPRKTFDIDDAVAKIVNAKRDRRANVRGLTEAAEAKVERDENMKKLEAIDAAVDAKREIESKLDNKREKAAKEALNRAKVNLEHRLRDAGKKELFNSVIFEMAFNACWVDDNVKRANVDSMYETFNVVIETLETNGITVDRTSDVTHFIANVHKVVNECGDKVAKRIAEDACDSNKTADELDEIDFSLNRGEMDEFTNSLADLGKEDIEELVRNKVLAVVQDEKSKGEEKAAEIDEIKTSQTDEEDPSDSDDVDVTKLSDEEGSAQEAFNAIVNRNRMLKVHRRTGTSLFECMMMYNTNYLHKHASTMETKVSDRSIMDAALQETVVVYTMMETLNTLGLCEFNNTNVKKLCDYYKIKYN